MDDPVQCLRAALVLLAWAIALQCLEDWRLARSALASRVATWSVLGSDLAATSPLWFGFLSVVFRPGLARAWILMRLGCALALLGQLAWQPRHLSECVLIVALWLLQLLSQLRWRGALNGGSDHMTLGMLNGLMLGLLLNLILAVLSQHEAKPPPFGYLDPQAVAQTTQQALLEPLSKRLEDWTHLPERAALWWISIQWLTSYFVSGSVKLLQHEWRTGAALVHFLNASVYGPLSSGSWLRHPWIAGLLAWSFMVWEALMPFTLLNPRAAQAACLIAVVFHLLVFVHFGLNRFFWIWIAGIPALLFVATELAAILG